MPKSRCAGYKLARMMAEKFGTTGTIVVELSKEVIQFQRDKVKFIQKVIEAHKKADKSKLRYGARGGNHVRSLRSVVIKSRNNHSSRCFKATNGCSVYL